MSTCPGGIEWSTNSRSRRFRELSAGSLGVFRGSAAVALGVSRNQLAALVSGGRDRAGAPRRVPHGGGRTLRRAAASCRAAVGRRRRRCRGVVCGRALRPPRRARPGPGGRRAGLESRALEEVVVHRATTFAPLMVRRHRGLRVTGVEATLVALGARARRRSVRDRVRGRAAAKAHRSAGVTHVPRPVRASGSSRRPRDPRTPRRARSRLPGAIDARGEDAPAARRARHHRLSARVPARMERPRVPLRLRVRATRTILETNGRRWHDDPTDYEHDNEKWSVPGRHGYRLVLATWDKVTQRPEQLRRARGNSGRVRVSRRWRRLRGRRRGRGRA